MLIKIGNVIFNTERLIKAEYSVKGEYVDDDGTPALYLRLAGGGTQEKTYSSLQFDGEEARAIWKLLCEEAREIVP
ncbi:MAG: hypothetical protein ABR577_15075 [Pyrinomonadaceae bacterium]